MWNIVETITGSIPPQFEILKIPVYFMVVAGLFWMITLPIRYMLKIGKRTRY